MDNAFEWDETSDGLCSEEEWPYAAKRHHFFGCKINQAKCIVVPNTKVESFEDIEDSTVGLKTALSKQPVSVAIDASGVCNVVHDIFCFGVICLLSVYLTLPHF